MPLLLVQEPHTAKIVSKFQDLFFLSKLLRDQHEINKSQKRAQTLINR